MAPFTSFVCQWLVVWSCFMFGLSSGESFTFEVNDIAILPCNLPVYDTDKYWYYTGGVNGDVKMYLSMNDNVYYSQHYVMQRFGGRLTVRNDTDISNRPTYDLIISNLSFVDIGEYRCGYIGDDRIIRWVDVHHINVSELGIYDVECALHGPLVPNIGNTVEFYCEIPPQTIYPQKQVELVWYKNNKTLFMSTGLFAPSLAIRLQRTLIESDFGADFTCVAYDEFYKLKGQCSVSTFHIPLNVTVRLLASREDAAFGVDLPSLMCRTSGLSAIESGSEGRLQFSWYLNSHRIYPVTDPGPSGKASDESDSWLVDENNLKIWNTDDRGRVLTFNRYHSNLNNSVVVCGVRNDGDVTMAMPYILRFPADHDTVIPIPSGDYQTRDGAIDGGASVPSDQPSFHKAHHFNTFLAILTFIFGILVSLCSAGVCVILRRRHRRNPSAADELRWMPIDATVVDHSGVDTFIRRHYFKKPPKRLNVQERLKHRSGEEYPISPEHAHQVCLRNKLHDVRRARKSRSVSEDMFNFPLSFEDIPEFRSSKSRALHNLSRSSSLRDFHLDLPGGKARYVNLPSEYATPTPVKVSDDESKPPTTTNAEAVTDTNKRCLPRGHSPTNQKAAPAKIVTYAELDLVHLNAMKPSSAKTDDTATYAEISHVIPERINGKMTTVNTNADINSETNSEINFI